MVAQAMSRADLVIIPMKGWALDALGAIKAIKVIHRQERAYNRKIPFSVLLTQNQSGSPPSNPQEHRG